MNARERAIAVAEETERAGRGTISFQGLSAIEQAIVAAEEERAKEEREACRLIAQEIKEREQAEGYEFAATEIEKRIRARSES